MIHKAPAGSGKKSNLLSSGWTKLAFRNHGLYTRRRRVYRDLSLRTMPEDAIADCNGTNQHNPGSDNPPSPANRDPGDGICTPCWKGSGGSTSTSRHTLHVKSRHILADGDCDSNYMRSPFVRVVLGKTSAEPVRLDSNDRVGILVKRSSTAKDLDADRILLDLVRFASEELFAETGQKVGELWCADKLRSCKNRLELSPLHLEIDRFCACHRHRAEASNRPFLSNIRDRTYLSSTFVSSNGINGVSSGHHQACNGS